MVTFNVSNLIYCLQNCAALPGSPRLLEQPLTDVIAHVRSQNKVTSEPQAANFQSALTPRFSRRSKYDAAAEGTLPRSRWNDFEDLACHLGSSFSYPLDKALTSTVENIYHAITKIHRGPGIPKDWVISSCNEIHILLIIPAELCTKTVRVGVTCAGLLTPS